MRLKKSFGTLALSLIFGLPIFAQTASPTPPVVEDDEVIKVESRLVVVPVSVLDSNNQPVLGLKAQDFRILEENKAQEIAQVSDAEKVPLEIVLLFDVSASTDAMFQFEQETAARFLQEVMKPEDRATIFTIGSNPRLIQARDSADKSGIAIKSIQPTKSFTAFYDTVAAAAEYLQKNAPQGRRKVVVVISDGEDTNSERIRKAIQNGYEKIGKKVNTLDSKSLYQLTVANRNEASLREQNRVMQNLQNADAVFYSVNPGGNSYQLSKISQFGQSNLQKFADQTGGTAFLPKFLPIDSKDKLQNSSNIRKNQEILTKIFRQLANELQAQYLVQYYSDANFPTNKYVKLDVGITNPNQYRVRARQGYFVKN
ncbi:MAG: VWA domain-containing protein [Acidobacteriota bacterium]|nr:VWA domain-containing protein [Acidobacteriota bacterium]